MSEQNSTLLEFFKLRKGITNTAKDAYWKSVLDLTVKELRGKGMRIDEASAEDCCFVADYAAWKTDDTQPSMPKWIRAYIRDAQIRGRADGE